MASRSITRSCSQLTTSHSSSAARTFLQLAPRTILHNPPQPVLDFLLPDVSSRAFHHRHITRSIPACSHTPQKRTFASSPIRQQTSAIVNPRKDDDGIDMNVEITPRASNRLKEIMSKDSNPNLALRIQVESGGCHGFQYLMSLTSLPPLDFTSSKQEETPPALNTSSNDPNAIPSKTASSPPFPGSWKDSKAGELDEDDTVFAADDGSGAKVVMDGPSLELLKGSKIDYTMELIGSQFKIVDNPLATSSCGCGTSFDIKA